MISLSAAMEWDERQTDGSKCEICKEIIIGKMYQLVTFIDLEPFDTEHKVCEPCYNTKDE